MHLASFYMCIRETGNCLIMSQNHGNRPRTIPKNQPVSSRAPENSKPRLQNTKPRRYVCDFQIATFIVHCWLGGTHLRCNSPTQLQPPSNHLTAEQHNVPNHNLVRMSVVVPALTKILINTVSSRAHSNSRLSSDCPRLTSIETLLKRTRASHRWQTAHLHMKAARPPRSEQLTTTPAVTRASASQEKRHQCQLIANKNQQTARVHRFGQPTLQKTLVATQTLTQNKLTHVRMKIPPPFPSMCQRAQSIPARP